MKEFLASTYYSLGTPQNVKWPRELIILSVGHLDGLTENQLNS